MQKFPFWIRYVGFLLLLVAIIIGAYYLFFRSDTKPQKSVAITDQVFQLNTYSWDELGEEFIFNGYGSAVLIDKSTIVTNAHVILGKENKPTGYYEVCVSPAFDEKPLCSHHARLLQYDINTDLALLEIEDMFWEFTNPVTLSKEKLELGEDVIVYGYPANGGNTITLTQGKISGFEQKNYKMDANLDGGSSGGGGFDTENKLVGVPVFVAEGYTTLGYMIPSYRVQDFLDKKGSVITVDKPVDDKFLTFLEHDQQVRSQTDSISTPFFSVEDFSDYGFHLDYAHQSIDMSGGYFSLLHDDGVSNIYISYGAAYGNTPLSILDQNKEKFVGQSYDSYTVEDFSWKDEQGKVIIAQGVPEVPDAELHIFDRDVIDGIGISFSTNGFSPQAEKDAYELLSSHVTFVATGSNHKAEQEAIVVGDVRFSLVENMMMFQDYEYGYLSYSLVFPVPSGNVGQLEFLTKTVTTDKKRTLKEIIDQQWGIQELLQHASIISEGTKVSKQGIPYYEIQREGYGDTIIFYIFFAVQSKDKEDTLQIFTLTYSTAQKDAQTIEMLYTFLNAITTDGTIPFTE